MYVITTKYLKLNALESVNLNENLTLFQAVENWLDRERDQLPLWLPVGIGFGIAIWQSGGTSIWIGVLVTSIALSVFSLLIPLGSRFRQIVQIFSLTLPIGFSLIALRSEVVAQPVLGKIWVGEFYGRVDSVENISARDVFRLRLATGPESGLPPFVRVNLKPEQFRESFQPGSILRLRARLMPPAGPALPGGYDFARRAWFQQIGAAGSALGEVQLYQPASGRPLLASQREGPNKPHIGEDARGHRGHWRCACDRRSGTY